MTDVPQETEAGAAPGMLGRALEWVGDRLNPILVKETRQALKSKQFTLWFVLLLIACWVTTIGAIAIIGPSIYYVSAGRYLLFAYYVILALPLVVVAPFSAFRSLASEHEDNTRDLLEVSTLTPRQVINGKLGSALLQIGVYLSALTPCLAFTYLLRGVSLVQIGLLLLYAVLASIGLSVVGLVLAATSRQKYAQVVISVALAGVLFGAFGGLLQIAGVVLGLDLGSLRDEGFWWGNLAALSLYATTFAVAYTAAVSLTTFTSANRSTALRLAATVQSATLVAWAGGLVAVGMPSQGLFTFAVVAILYWFIAGALMTGEAPTLSLRVRRSLPQSLLGRAVGSWYNPGSGSGYVLASTQIATCALLAVLVMLYGTRGVGNLVTEAGAKAIGMLAAYAIAYLGVGRLAVCGLRRVTTVSPLGCFLIQVLFALGGSSLPFVVQTLSERVRANDLVLLSLPSPAWNVSRLLSGSLDPARELGVLVAVGAAATILFLVNLAMAGREARQLRVAAPRRVVEDDRELHPEPEPQATNPWGDRPEPVADPS